MPRSSTPLIAASRHIGTIRITASGSSTLSYCAASSRNTNTTARLNAITAVLPATFSCKAISVHSKPKPDGRFRQDLFHGGDRLAGREARQRRALHLGGGEQIVARHAIRAR